jgi:copper chaperone CopZ
MKRIVLEVPGMYGDHHVLRVREVLLGAQGISEATASAARRTVAVKFDEKATSAEAIQETLSGAGYPPDASLAREFPERHKDGSGWYLLPSRRTTTERKDREMAGDFRRY